MRTRIGKVTNIYPSTGKVKVMYEDEKCSSLPLALLTMNREYSMPSIGDRVVTIHMENGSSKGFVLGTYYGGGVQPKANSGYRKDFGSGAYASCNGGAYLLSAKSASIKDSEKASMSGGGASVLLDGDASLIGANVTIGSMAVSDGEEAEGDLDEAEPTAFLKFTEEEVLLKAPRVMVEADEITLKCSYGTITVEEMMKRLERIEDQLGLPHEM